MSETSMAFVRLGALGDVVRLLPLVSAAKRRWGAGRLLWIVGASAAPLLRLHPEVDEVWEVPRLTVGSAGAWLRLARAFRRREVSVCFDLQGLAKSGFWTLASGARRRLGLGRDRAREGSSWVLTERLDARPRSRYEEALDLLGLGWEDWQAGSAALQRAWGLADRPRSGILLHPGGSARNAYKRWPPERFAEVALLLSRATGQSVQIHFGAGERELAERIVANVPEAVASGSSSLEELTRRIASASLFIGGDSGPLHLALLCGTPSVAIYGSSDPMVYALPPCAEHRVVRVAVPCAPCKHRSCSTLECLEQLQARQVAEAGLSLLKGRE